MQTFLPSRDFAYAAKLLDNKRLGKQRVECLQILAALTGYKCDPESGQVIANPSTAWTNHPATKMWANDLPAFISYSLAVCVEWTRRGFKDTCREKLIRIFERYRSHRGLSFAFKEYADTPAWVTQDLVLSHQSNLIRKDPAFYAPLFPGVPNDRPYIWPTQLEELV